jgi:hypothetical protein
MGGQPLATPDDCLEAERIARASPRVQAVLAERGVSMDQVTRVILKKYMKRN